MTFRIFVLTSKLLFLLLCITACSFSTPQESSPADTLPTVKEEAETLMISIDFNESDTNDEDLIQEFNAVYEELASISESSEEVLYMPREVFESMFKYRFVQKERYLYAYYSQGMYSYGGIDLSDHEYVLVIEFGLDNSKVPGGYPTTVVLGRGIDLRDDLDHFLLETIKNYGDSRSE